MKTVSDHTMKAEALGKIIEIGKKFPTDVIKKPSRALEIGSSAVNKKHYSNSVCYARCLENYHTGKGLYLEKIL